MSSYSAELAELIKMNSESLPDMRDDLYPMLFSIEKLTGSPEEIKQQEDTLRSAYRVKLNTLSKARTEKINQQWNKVKALVTKSESLENHPKLNLVWDLAWRKTQAWGFAAVIKEFHDLVPLIKD